MPLTVGHLLRFEQTVADCYAKCWSYVLFKSDHNYVYTFRQNKSGIYIGIYLWNLIINWHIVCLIAGDPSFAEPSLPEQLSDWLQVASAISWLVWILGLG